MILSRFGVDLSFRRLVAPVSLFALVCSIFAADPVVSNVQAKQREGSRLVDITYDVADPDSPTLTVYLKVSADGGKTWKGPVELVSGDVGLHIAPGTAKRLVWDAGKEMPNQFGVKYRYRIGASDQWIGEPGMALIPAGPFQMGDDRVTGPVHTVTVSMFAMDKWEVSIELWESVRLWGNEHGYDLVIGGSYGAKHPVYGVSWYAVVKWCNARSEKEGKVPAYYEDVAMTKVYRGGEKVPAGVKWDAGYRLPTEAEWEKAARGGVAGKLYPWGTDEISPELANYRGSNKGGTTPIGSYAANGYGLYDMAGNVFEWCWDLWGYYENAPQTNPRGPSSGWMGIRVIRGGSWNISACCGDSVNFCRLAFRGNIDPDYGPNSYGHCGFRSVLPPGQP
jgi:formylglycine-generating enzyme required for sulfatase activity